MKMIIDLQQFAVPFRRTSKTKKRMRRTHLKLEAPTNTVCPNCGKVITPHRACSACGFYKGKDVLHLEKEEVTPVKEVKKTTKKAVKTAKTDK